jgi:hypothetical protein
MQKIKQEIKQLRARLQELEAQLEERPIVPNSWDECDKTNSWFIGYWSNLYLIERPNEQFTYNDINVIPTKELAEAMLALCQLLVLRNETWKRDGNWQPDWSEESENYSIHYMWNDIDSDSCCYGVHYLLAFRTPEIRDKFLEKHRSIIEIAKPLL